MAHQVTTTIDIAAVPEAVWAVLADLPSYPRWHPAFVSVAGQLVVGSKLTITAALPTGRTITAKVTVRTVEPGSELRWVSKLLGVTISDRRFLLSPAGGGSTLVQSETYRGLGRGRGSPRVIERVMTNFGAINQAIKQRAETGPPART
jgi:hypothetical protein